MFVPKPDYAHWQSVMFVPKPVYARWLNIKLYNLIKYYLNQFKYERKRMRGVLNLKILERQ